MKKIILIFILCWIIAFSLNWFKASADSYQSKMTDLIIIKDHPLNQEDINIDDLTILVNNVNYNMVGSYNIIYVDGDNNEYKRNVYVIDKNDSEIEKGFIVNVPIPSITNYEVYEVKNKINTFFVIGEYTKATMNVFELFYYEDGLLYWHQLFRNAKFLFGFIYEEKDNYYLNIIYKDGLSNKHYIRIDKRQNLIEYDVILNNPLSVYFNTYNNCIYFLYEKKIEKYKYKTLSKIDEIDLTSSFIIKKGDTLNYYSHINIDERFRYYLKLNDTLYALDITSSLSVTKIEALPLYDYTNNIFNSNGSLLSYELEDNRVVKYSYYDDYKENSKKYTNIFELEDKVSKIDTIIINDLFILNIYYIDGITQEIKIYDELLINSTTNERRKKSSKALIEETSFNLTIINNLEVCFQRNTIVSNTQNINTNIDYEKIYIFLNGKLVDIDQNLDYSLFGSYHNVLTQDIDNNHLILNYDYYVYDSCNIIDGEVYQKGVLLSFVGSGKLNDSPIEPNTKVLDSGRYTLLLEGMEERKNISFEVKELNEDSIYYDALNKKDYTKGKTEYHETKLEENKIDINDTNIKRINPYIYILMTLIVSVLINLILLFTIKRRNK